MRKIDKRKSTQKQNLYDGKQRNRTIQNIHQQTSPTIPNTNTTPTA